MKKLIETLHKGTYTLVMANGDDIRCFTNRGVIDIYTTIINEPQFSKGALVADKIIGKAAAAIMVFGGATQVYTDIISKGALELFNKHNIEIEYTKIVPHIINRDGSDWCPLELRCEKLSDVEKITLIVGDFLQEMRMIH